MLRFFLARIVTAVPTLFIIIALAFFLMRLASGGPFDTERALDPEIAKNLRRIYHLDRPLLEQFWLYLQSLAHGDLGPSLHWRDFSVNELFAKALPISATLGAKAMLLAILAGTELGLAGANLLIGREFTTGGGGFGYGKRRTLFISQRDNRRLDVSGELKNNAGYLILRIGGKTPRGLKGLVQQFCHVEMIHLSERA